MVDRAPSVVRVARYDQCLAVRQGHTGRIPAGAGHVVVPGPGFSHGIKAVGVAIGPSSEKYLVTSQPRPDRCEELLSGGLASGYEQPAVPEETMTSAEKIPPQGHVLGSAGGRIP